MEKDRGAKIIAIIALLVGIVGLSVGFAAMTANLKITSSAAVTPAATDFKVQFSTTESTVSGETGTVNTSNTSGGATGDAATFTNGNAESTLSGVKANFTEPGQSVTYSLYGVNAGKYVAYLNSITFDNYSSGNAFKVCTPGNETTASTVNATAPETAACDGISLKISVGSLTDVTPETSGISSISSHSLAPLGEANNSEIITVTITYEANAKRADGDFTVNFGDITLRYDAVD